MTSADSVPQLVSRTRYAALEAKCKKLSEENKKLRNQRAALRASMGKVLSTINDVLRVTGSGSEK